MKPKMSLAAVASGRCGDFPAQSARGAVRSWRDAATGPLANTEKVAWP